MANIVMLDSQQCDLTVTEKNSQGQVIAPNPAIQATTNLPAVVDLVISADNSTVTVKGKPLTSVQSPTITVSAVANPNVAKATQVFTINPDPAFPTSLTLTAGPVAPQ